MSTNLRGLHTTDVGACGIPLSDLIVPLTPVEIAQHFLYRDNCSREGWSGKLLSFFPARVSAPLLPENGPTTDEGFTMLDDYTINMSDNISGVFLPVTQSVDMSALTQPAVCRPIWS